MNRWKKLAIISSLCLLPSISGLAYEQKAIYEKPDGSNIGARTTFGYKDDSMFKVNTKPGFVTDIQLREGEELTYVAGGDTKSWLIDKAKVGSVQHVYIKPLEPGKHTNIIINTDMHTYRLDVWSSMDAFDPLITFAFMGDRKVTQPNLGTENFLPPTDKRLNKDYTIKAKKMEKYSELIPSSIMDDGQRTYIRIPDTNKYDMPVLYMVNPWDKKQTLVNYRVQGGYFVVDAVMAHGRLFYHQKFKVDFYNNAKQHSMSEQEKINNRRDSDTVRMSEWGMNRSEPVYADDVQMNPVEEEVYVAPQEIKPVKKVRPEPVSVAPRSKTAIADMVAREAETGKPSSYKRPEVQGMFEQPIIEVREYGPGQNDGTNVVKYVPPFVDSQDNKEAIKAQMAQEKAQRIAQEKLEAQRRLEQERAIAKANADRLAYEKEQARLMKEREAQMRAQQAEQARLEKARLAEQERIQKAQLAEQARMEKARQAEQARMQAEQEKMRKAQLAEQAKLEKARQAEYQRQQAEQLKAEQLRQAELARQQKEQEKLEKARIAEYNRQQAEQAKAEKLRQEQLQRQQMEQMKAEQARQAQLEKERIANEKRMEKERQAQIHAQEAQMRAQQAEQAKLEKARLAEQERIQKAQLAEQAKMEKARQAEQAKLQAEQAKAQRAQLAQQQVAQRQVVPATPVIDKNFVQQVDNIHGPVQVMLSDGRVVPMREDQFRKLPLESRVQLVAQNRVRRG